MIDYFFILKLKKYLLFFWWIFINLGLILLGKSLKVLIYLIWGNIYLYVGEGIE